MRFLRYGEPGFERPGLLDEAGMIRDLSDAFSPAQPLPHREAIEMARSLDPLSLPLIKGPVRLGPVVHRPGKIIACGLNYADHIAESGLDAGPDPTFFLKATSSLSGPDDPIVIPPDAKQVDWEVELAAIIGRAGAYMDVAEAEEAIAGYAVFNDVSERHNQFQRGAGQWVKGKSADTFGPLGPYLVTPDELRIGELDIWLDRNGERMQSSNTRALVFSPAELVAYASQFMSLQPGDIVATGTPGGVGMGRTPPSYLRPGDRLRLGIDGLGEQNNVVVAYSGSGETRAG